MKTQSYCIETQLLWTASTTEPCSMTVSYLKWRNWHSKTCIMHDPQPKLWGQHFGVTYLSLWWFWQQPLGQFIFSTWRKSIYQINTIQKQNESFTFIKKITVWRTSGANFCATLYKSQAKYNVCPSKQGKFLSLNF